MLIGGSQSHAHNPCKQCNLAILWELTWQIQNCQAKISTYELALAIALTQLDCLGLPFCAWDQIQRRELDRVISSPAFLVNLERASWLQQQQYPKSPPFLSNNFSSRQLDSCWCCYITLLSFLFSMPIHNPSAVKFQHGSGLIRLSASTVAECNFPSSWHSNRHCCHRFLKGHRHFCLQQMLNLPFPPELLTPLSPHKLPLTAAADAPYFGCPS